MRGSPLVLVSLLAALVVAQAASAATTKTVSIKRSSFSPAAVSITAFSINQAGADYLAAFSREVRYRAR
ncbi:MAG TPA: hypothetical protein VFV62_00935 [Gaiellaceae bacterium]|nr:hypothetical protein [Gaiellaceae bacterium]